MDGECVWTGSGCEAKGEVGSVQFVGVHESVTL